MTEAARPEAHQQSASAVRANQLGYLPRGPKRATLVTDSPAPVPFELRDGHGRVLWQGASQPAGPVPDAGSGLRVQVLDASAFDPGEEPLTGCTFTAEGQASLPFRIGGGHYAELARDAMAFFYAQRSGIEIDDALLPGHGRPAAHLGTGVNRGDTAVPIWRGPDAARLYPDYPPAAAAADVPDGTAPDGAGARCYDVSGGWYDAGDHGKYVVNAGLSVALLLDAYRRDLDAEGAPRLFGDKSLRVPEAGDGVPDLLSEVRWELEWLLRMQVPAGEPYAGLAFHKVHDDRWTALPIRPHEDAERRVLHRPSTAAALNLAAAAAQAAGLFARYDPAFAERLLGAARTGYAAALRHPAVLAPAEAGRFGGGAYEDEDVSDEFYWAATELYLATGEQQYADDLGAWRHHQDDARAFPIEGFTWNEVGALARLRLASAPSALPESERARLADSVSAAADRLLAVQRSQPWDQPYAPADGHYVWGSNGQILNNVVVLGSAFDLTGEARFLDGALRGLDYVLGRNALGLSFVTGYGGRAVQHPHHRHWVPSLDPTMPPPPAGALSGGPNSRRYGFPEEEAKFAGLPPQLCFEDSAASYTTNEVAINWNAALVWAAAFAARQA